MGTLNWLNNRMNSGGIKIVEATTPASLESEIKKYTRKGWQLQGTPQVTSNWGQRHYSATMVQVEQQAPQYDMAWQSEEPNDEPVDNGETRIRRIKAKK